MQRNTLNNFTNIAYMTLTQSKFFKEGRRIFESLSASDPFRILFVYPIKTGRVRTGFLPAVLQNTVENVVSRYDKINTVI